MRWRQAAFAALCHTDLFDTESCGRRFPRALAGKGPMETAPFTAIACPYLPRGGYGDSKSHLGTLLLCLCCHGNQCLLQLCLPWKKRSIVPSLAHPPKCAEDGGGLWSATSHLQQNGDGAARSLVTCLKTSSGHIRPSAVVTTSALRGGDAEHRAAGHAGPGSPGCQTQKYLILPE